MKIKTNIPANVPPSTPLRLLDLIFSVILIVLELVVLVVLIVLVVLELLIVLVVLKILVVLEVLVVLNVFISLVEISSKIFEVFKIVLDNAIADDE
jgi:hypothetical protein